MLKSKWIIVIIVIIVILFFMMSKGKVIDVETAKVELGMIKEYIEEDGETRLDDNYIISMPVGGEVLRIELEEGDTVSKGDVVALINDYSMKQQLKLLENKVIELNAFIDGVDKAKPKSDEIKSAEVQMKDAKIKIEAAEKELNIATLSMRNAEKDYNRMKKLLTDNVISQSEFDAAEERYKNFKENVRRYELMGNKAQLSNEDAQLSYNVIIESIEDNEYQRRVYMAQIKQIEAQISILEDSLLKTDIKSPVNGIVLEKNIESKQVLVAGVPLMKIGDIDTIEIETDILSEEIGKIKAGQAVEIIGKALENNAIDGKVKRIYPTGFEKISSLGVEQQRVKTIIEFDNSSYALRPGISVDVKIILKKSENVLTVPERALFRKNGQWHVFRINDNHIILTPVVIGIRNDEKAEVIKGLKENEMIVSDLINELKDGTRVNILD